MIKVLLADEAPVVRHGLRRLLCNDTTLRVVGEASQAHETVEMTRTHLPDVVLMDLQIGPKSCPPATSQLMALAKPPRVIVMTTFGRQEDLRQALMDGAAGCLPKNLSAMELIRAVRGVAAGHTVLSPSATLQLVTGAHTGKEISREESQKLTMLSDRQRSMLVLMAAGWRNTEIADLLGVSVSTVKSHVARMMGKLELDNRVQAAVLAHRAGLMDPQPMDAWRLTSASRSRTA
ncbi:response regulator [Streptomyces kronopolitis]|uniref:response regulator n=1 Tax=Streptomyces kronopolitis TaxID=1612435 RepID=UPI00367F6B91